MDKKTRDTRFHKSAEQLADLVSEKNIAYGDSANKVHLIMEILFPKGIPLKAYKWVLILTRILDKIIRLAEMLGKDDFDETDPMGEDPWQDIAGYGLLMVSGNSKNKDKEKG